jgi:hypothetical protein
MLIVLLSFYASWPHISNTAGRFGGSRMALVCDGSQQIAPLGIGSPSAIRRKFALLSSCETRVKPLVLSNFGQTACPRSTTWAERSRISTETEDIRVWRESSPS